VGDVTPMGLVAAFLAGAAVGVFFFVGLKMTVSRLPTSRRPVLLALSSMLIRTVVAVAVIVWIGNGRWQRYVAAIAAFILVKLIMIVVVLGRKPVKDDA